MYIHLCSVLVKMIESEKSIAFRRDFLNRFHSIIILWWQFVFRPVCI